MRIRLCAPSYGYVGWLHTWEASSAAFSFARSSSACAVCSAPSASRCCTSIRAVSVTHSSCARLSFAPKSATPSPTPLPSSETARLACASASCATSMSRSSCARASSPAARSPLAASAATCVANRRSSVTSYDT
eukprot:1178772-Prorocentrum_minimum.AAC.2